MEERERRRLIRFDAAAWWIRPAQPMSSPDLLVPTESGLYCPLGDFYVDPWRPVKTAVITHAHADHARPGSGRYICAGPGEGVLRIRMGTQAMIEAVAYREVIRLGDVRVSLHPAGHILGSSQVRIESGESVWVASGDYKRDPDPTCAGFEVVKCDVFITEATFALPIYRWRPPGEVVAELISWWDANAEAGRASVIFTYALGKSQRLAALLSGVRRPLYQHGSMIPLTRAYRAAGIELPEPEGLPERGTRKAPGVSLAGSLTIARPSEAGSLWMRTFGSAVRTASVSGWMRVRGKRRWRGHDAGFVLSDHADWFGLLETIQATGARKVFATHGATGPLVRVLREGGIEAQTLRTEFSADESEGEGGVEGAGGGSIDA